MTLEIHTRDIPIAFAMKNSPPPQGVSIFLPPMLQTRSAGSEQVASIIIHYGTDVLVGVLASWLYDRLKNGKSNCVIVNRREIEVTEGEITKIIEETISTYKGN